MKNKKLFAILTLVCFMFTLMPVAAFAADSADLYVAEKGNKDDDSITTTIDTAITVDVINDNTNNYYFWAEDADGDVVLLVRNAGQTATIRFDTVGTYYVYAVDASTIDMEDLANYTKSYVVGLIKDKDNYVEEALEVKVKKGSTEYVLSVDASTTNANVAGFTAATESAPAEVKIVADSGWTNEGEVSVFLKKADGTAVKGEEITFTTNSSYVDVEVQDELTNRNGKVVINITASRAGEYKVYANHSDADKLTIVVNATAKGVASIETVTQPANTVALGTDFAFNDNGYTGVAFEITSADGTILESALSEDDYKITIVEKPADSDLDADDLTLKYDSSTNNAYVLYDANDSAEFDAEGKYVIKVTLESGSSATATVKVVEFDTPVRMILTYYSNTVAYGDVAKLKAVSYMDANGTVMAVTHDDYSKYGSVEFAANGKAVKDVYEDNVFNTAGDYTSGVKYQAGSILTYGADEDGDEYVGTTITAVAINDELELTATATITVANAADTLEYQSTTADIAVNNKLIVNPVDEDGNVIAALSSTDKVYVYVLSAPANAAYSAEGKVTDTDELTVTFTASAVGEYKLQTVVKTGTSYLSSVDTIVVGGTTSQFEDVVVMSIGSSKVVVNSNVATIDAAPMIQNDRTFVPFRALAEAFGATVAFDEATQSVTAELNGTTVIMTIGSAEYTVNGVAKTADVAPFINDSRTMVPVRFVAEAFGITVTPLYGENGETVDVLFAK